MLTFVSYIRNRTLSPLLKLPPEIRQIIYEYALGDQCILIKYKPHKWSRGQKDGTTGWVHTVQGGFHCTTYDRQVNPFTVAAFPTNAPAERRGFRLLSPVCRQLYQETATLPFELNVLAFENGYVLNRYIMKERRLSLPLRRAIRTLFVQRLMICKNVEKYIGGIHTLYVNEDRCVLEYDRRTGEERKLDKTALEIRYEKRMMN